MGIFTWMNDQILKMVWLEKLFQKLFGDVLGIDPSSMLYDSLVFFFYDTVKIFFLLSALIFLFSYLQANFTPERTRKILGNFKGVKANAIGALMGTITPFCSCSSIPIFIGFTKAGLPIGVTFSFLISSPFVDLASVLLLASIFNWKIALAYVVVGIVLAVVGGTLISALHMENQIESFVFEPTCAVGDAGGKISRKQRVRFAFEELKQILKRVWVYVLIGVGIGAVIHGYIPGDLIEKILGGNNPFSVVIATIAGVPMYADIFGTLPIAEALVFKGVQIGTVLAFMMAVTALSLPSLIMLKKVVKTKLLLVFTGILVLGIILIGYLFNLFGNFLL